MYLCLVYNPLNPIRLSSLAAIEEGISLSDFCMGISRAIIRVQL